MFTGIIIIRTFTSLEIIQCEMKMVIWLHSPTVFWLRGGTISHSYSMYVGLVSHVRHTEIHTAEPLVPEQSGFEFHLAIGN